MLIVADSSPLVALALCGTLDILEKLFDEVQVPQAVYDEVIVKGKPAAHMLQTYLQGKVVSIPVENILITGGRLGQGEIEAMALYRTSHADYLLVDDHRARKIAQLNHITITGSQGVLLLAKHRKLIPHVKPYLDKLSQTDIWLSESLIQRTLSLAEE